MPQARMTGLRTAAALAMALALAGCTTTGGGNTSLATSTPAPNTTNAPVSGGINVQPGSEEDFMVNIGRRTFFAESSAKLDQTAMVTLDKQAEWMLRYPQWKVKIQGFADDPGSAAQNTAISKKRAEAVKAYLVSKGVPAENLYAKGYGRDRLVQDCADISCKAQNRRVVSNPQEDGEF